MRCNTCVHARHFKFDSGGCAPKSLCTAVSECAVAHMPRGGFDVSAGVLAEALPSKCLSRILHQAVRFEQWLKAT